MCGDRGGGTARHGAEDSLSFLPALLGKPHAGRRTTLVNHSNFGEFADRDGPWKLVWRSRHGQKAANDTTVRFDTTQEKRWAK